MTLIKNLRIGAKLALGFGLLLALVLVLAVYAIYALSSTAESYQRIQDGPQARYLLLENMDMAITDMRHKSTLIALYSGDTERISAHEAELDDLREYVRNLAQRFRDNLVADPVMSQDARNTRTGQINSLENSILAYVNNHILPIQAAAHANDLSEAIHLIYVKSHADEAIDAEFNALFGEISAYLTQANADNTASTNASIRTKIIVSAVIFVLGIVIAIVITRLITRPINEIVGTVNDVAHGHLNVNIRTDSKDETGDLARSTQQLVDTLQRLIKDMDGMADDHSRGEIDSFIHAGNFDGEYGTVADKINDMLKSTLDTQNLVVGTFIEIAEGNFKADLPPQPGKKASLNEAVNGMREQINAVAGEINFLIDAAAVKGDLAVNIQEAKYSGGWRDIMVGLNNLAKAVNDPIEEIRDAISELGKGSFATKVNGSYPGDFKVIKDAVNGTIDSLNGYIKEMSEMLGSISAGDLTRSISRNYVGEFSQIKDSINNISGTLNKTMSEITTASEQVLSGAKQISTSAMDLANGATEQASSVQELNASIDLINQQTKLNAENAEQANGLSTTSTQNAREGNDAMKEMLTAMEQIKDSSHNISRIIKTIQDISFQTNLLSLNAAVEAARAGEHGKGFSVVAEEVRNLASRSQAAATETDGLISESISRVDSGADIAVSTSESLDVIVTGATEISDIINGIFNASKEQAEAISQVSVGLQQISQVVQSNSAVSQETAAASQQLNSQAELLQQLVGYFKV